MKAVWSCLVLGCGLAAGAAAAQGTIAVPSGQSVWFVETIQGVPGPEGFTMRFRFLAPEIAREGGRVDADTALADMQALCDGFALSRIATTGPQPAQIVISLMDRPLAFGETVPEATQYFEAFSPSDGHCIWEPF